MAGLPQNSGHLQPSAGGAPGSRRYRNREFLLTHSIILIFLAKYRQGQRHATSGVLELPDGRWSHSAHSAQAIANRLPSTRSHIRGERRELVSTALPLDLQNFFFTLTAHSRGRPGWPFA